MGNKGGSGLAWNRFRSGLTKEGRAAGWEEGDRGGGCPLRGSEGARWGAWAAWAGARLGASVVAGGGTREAAPSMAASCGAGVGWLSHRSETKEERNNQVIITLFLRLYPMVICVNAHICTMYVKIHTIFFFLHWFKCVFLTILFKYKLIYIYLQS